MRKNTRLHSDSDVPVRRNFLGERFGETFQGCRIRQWTRRKRDKKSNVPNLLAL